MIAAAIFLCDCPDTQPGPGRCWLPGLPGRWWPPPRGEMKLAHNFTKYNQFYPGAAPGRAAVLGTRNTSAQAHSPGPRIPRLIRQTPSIDRLGASCKILVSRWPYEAVGLHYLAGHWGRCGGRGVRTPFLEPEPEYWVLGPLSTLAHLQGGAC